MGIRIHKAMGWGFEGRHGELCDLTAATFYTAIQNLGGLIPDRLRELLIREYDPKHWVSDERWNSAIGSLIGTPSLAKLPAGTTMIRQTPGLVMLHSPFVQTSFRKDDSIDHHEAGAGDSLKLLCPEPVPPLKLKDVFVLSGGASSIWPDSGAMIGSTGEWLGAGEYNQLVGRWCHSAQPAAKGPRLKELRTWRPRKPVWVVLLLWLLEQRSIDVDAIWERCWPMVYTYWE